MPRGFGLAVGVFIVVFLLLFLTLLASILTVNFRLACFHFFFPVAEPFQYLSLICYPHCETIWIFHPSKVGPSHASHSMLQCPGPERHVPVQLSHFLCSDTAQDQHTDKSSCFVETQDGFFHGRSWKGVWSPILHLFTIRWTLQPLMSLSHL